MSQGLNKRTEAILRRLLRKDAGASLRKVLAKTRPPDVAAALHHLTPGEQRGIFVVLNAEEQARLLPYLNREALLEVTGVIKEERLVEVLHRMEPDDATDILGQLPDDVRERVVALLPRGEDDDVAELLAWPSDSAGGIMSNLVFSMPQEATCGEAIAALQQHHDDYEALFYLYVVDSEERLVGVVPLRKLLVHPPARGIQEVMGRDVISVLPSEDQEEVARIVARYDLLAVPVVDQDRHLLGVVTVDDVVDVIREEAAEDMMRLAGVNEGLDVGSRSAFTQARQRVGWLIATGCAGLFADRIIHFLGPAGRLDVLAGFIPVVMGMGGNVGVQSATIAVRGIATGHVAIAGARAFIFREARVGSMLGLGYGLTIGAYGLVFGDGPRVGLVVGLAVFIAILLGSLLGSGMPILLSRFKVDPAVATGPFVTSTVDLIAIVVYLSLATALAA